MRVVERVQVKYSKELSRLCHLAKNLYNFANWEVRQFLFHLGEFVNYYDLEVMLKGSPAYKSLPAQTSQQTLRLVARNWKAFFRAMKSWKQDPSKFTGRPRPPGYKKKDGESIAIFTNQNTRIRDGKIHFPRKCNLPLLKTRVTNYQQVRVLPRGNVYIIEIVYEREEVDLKLNGKNVLGIDIGLANLVTTANNVGLQPIIVKGGVVKSTNQFYNKERARLTSIRDKQKYSFQTRKLQRLNIKRRNKMGDTFHKVSRYLVNYCVENDIGRIVIGYNAGWKQNSNLGRRNNQNFVNVPFYQLVQNIEYKAKLVGIEVTLQDESYTSKCSFLDNEDVGKHSKYLGRRVRRGLFRSRNGTLINADVNAACNIIRKAFPETLWVDGIEGVGLHPVSVVT
jgi:putative transposase